MSSCAIAVLLFLLTQNAAFAETPPDAGTHRKAYGPVEFIIQGRLLTQAEAMGEVPNLQRQFDYVKMVEGKEVSHTAATLDENGFRLSSASHLPGKAKHLFVFGASTMFGEGLQDDETIPHLLNLKSKTYEAYSVGYLSFGIQHIWLRLKEGNLPKQIPFHRGRAALVIGAGTQGRVFGTLHDLFMVEDFPYVTEQANGEFVNLGSFADHGKWWQRLLIKICLPVTACRNLLAKADNSFTDDQLRFEGRMIDEIEKMYRAQFDAEDFWVIWQGTPDTVEKIRKYTKAKVLAAPEVEMSLGHPTPRGAVNVVEFLYKKGIAL